MRLTIIFSSAFGGYGWKVGAVAEMAEFPKTKPSEICENILISVTFIMWSAISVISFLEIMDCSVLLQSFYFINNLLEVSNHAKKEFDF